MIKNFFYRFKQFNGSSALVIHHMGDASIEQAVKEIEIVERLELRYRLIIFKNGEGEYDGYNIPAKQIIAIGEENWALALETLYNYKSQIKKTA